MTRLIHKIQGVNYMEHIDSGKFKMLGSSTINWAPQVVFYSLDASGQYGDHNNRSYPFFLLCVTEQCKV